MRRLMAGLLLLVPGLAMAGVESLREDAVKTGEVVGSINKNLDILDAQKLDKRPTDVLPREDSKYSLGSSTYQWVGLYVDTVTALSVVGNHSVLVSTGNGHGSSGTMIRRFSASDTTGSAITYADSSTNGATFTINSKGLYSITYTDFSSAGTCALGISVNASSLTTAIGSTSTTAGKRAATTTAAANALGSVSASLYLNSGDIIRAHDNSSCNGATHNTFLIITKIGI